MTRWPRTKPITQQLVGEDKPAKTEELANKEGKKTIKISSVLKAKGRECFKRREYQKCQILQRKRGQPR